MGFYNSRLFQSRLDSFLRSQICPISKQKMQPCSEDYKSGYSSFHYICPHLHLTLKIGISGSLISNQDNLYELLKNQAFIQNYVIEKIKNCTDEEILITTQMIREALSSQISNEVAPKTAQNAPSNPAPAPSRTSSFRPPQEK
ncbi:hypothetical protein [Hugenholtzia roseola]|uniref:hypothetical protein n=1 Tax=Hugenholtzia roseola TaxID=1002 RepID=UPI000420209A|nr:hypothetical protein [Hugenholtzia roseola]